MINAPLLFINVLIIATCGLVYELIAGTLASYVLGNSVTQFSTCIGVYLSAMGVGAWLSGFIEKRLARSFIEIELAVALLGGFSAPILFIAFAYTNYFYIVLYGIVFAIGTLVGLELPLLMRILRESMDFKHIVSRVLTFDYIGALAGSLLFPIVLVPSLGLVRTSLVFGFLNAVVGLWGTWILQEQVQRVTFIRFRAVLVLLGLTVGFIKADSFTTFSEDRIYSDPVVYSTTSHYQRIVVTQGQAGFQLYLDGNLQFSSSDEYRYHEALAHPAMLIAEEKKNVLVLGGGDGLACREILRYPSVESVTLVDLDPAMTSLSDHYPPLRKLNEEALSDPRMTIINADAMNWIDKTDEQFDVCLIDFPDPNNFSLGKLYTRRFYRMLSKVLDDNASIGIQCSSPFYSRQAYWCVLQTLESAGFHVRPYHATVPSFGVWGFAVAKKHPFSIPSTPPDGLRFLDESTLQAMFVFGKDLQRVPAEINRLDNQSLVRYYSLDRKSWQGQ